MTGQTTPPSAAPDSGPLAGLAGKQVLLVFNPRSGQGESTLPDFVTRLGQGEPW